ncbi:hypothetical protein GQ607_007562 [Colletotrichum asianum]|uniref:Secreted protein n=1 Tax=Colletotrichum asianum TaxID=702518 RepID=A0A8H3WFA8_9PEZI|nr:hypothetical protein GQ607_007562 [Colletotrichum asianum]
MKASFLISALLISSALGAIDDYCTDSNGNVGTCQKTSKCSSLNGLTVNNKCPNDPANVKCCLYPDCKTESGICKKDSLSCPGGYVTGECPGKAHYRCCKWAQKPPICTRGDKGRRCIPVGS